MSPVPEAVGDPPADDALLAGRVAIITGASRGLGAGLAARFAARGLRLALCARQRPAGPGSDPDRFLTEAVDVADAASVDRFAERAEARFGRIDLWINNAGVLEPLGPQRDHDPAEVERALLVNVGGVAHGTRAFTRWVRRQGRTGPDGNQPGGADPSPLLVNLSSGASRSVYEGWSIYGATKAAVDHFTTIVAAEEPEIRCLAVAPGVVETGMQELIRQQDEATFPAVARFHQIKAEGSANSPAWVADHLLAVWAGALDPGGVVYRVPNQHS